MHIGGIDKSGDKMPEIKFITWLVYDVTMFGVGGYSLSISFLESVSIVEKLLILICFLIFFIYRISILHLEREKKKMDNELQRVELEERKKKLKPPKAK